MWAQACEMLEQAERMHRQFFRLGAPRPARPVWEPPVNVYEDESEIVIVVALPGVSPERIEVTLNSGVLAIRAESRMPFEPGRSRDVRRLEIPYGYFERRIELAALPLQAGTQTLVNGCLVLTLKKVS